MSKTLKIVRFCWPEMLAERRRACSETEEKAARACFDPETWDGDDYSMYGVVSAERVLIERGLAEEYGEALAKEARVVADPKQFEATIFRILSAVRTLPSDVIIRAMVRVIDAQEEKK